MQPAGYVHSLGFLDQARYLRYQFRRLGASVTLLKNRLREDAVNIVFGAHLGFPLELLERHACVFVNLEQLGAGGAALAPQYFALLRDKPVLDYDQNNPQVYSSDPAAVPIIEFGFAPYLVPAASEAKPLCERPVDLLFFGSMNERRKSFIAKITAAGGKVTVLDKPLYGKERDEMVRSAKAVLNCHFYETNRFEQARAFQCMSLGTPVISERTPQTRAPGYYEETVFWLDEDKSLDAFFGGYFGSAQYYSDAAAKLDDFAHHDLQPVYIQALKRITDCWSQWQARPARDVWRPRHINLGSGKDYMLGWLNVDSVGSTQPDLLLDLALPLTLPLRTISLQGAPLDLQEGDVEQVYAKSALAQTSDLPCLMGNVLQLLKVGGLFVVDVPYADAPTPWQDPTHVRTFNEHSWLHYTDGFWRLAWTKHRFELGTFTWLDSALKPCDKPQAEFMRVGLRKIETSPAERSVARAMSPDFGGLEEDWPVPQ